jgi:hypothetical protein
MDMPPHARAGRVGRGHRFAAYPRCSTDVAAPSSGKMPVLTSLVLAIAALAPSGRCSCGPVVEGGVAKLEAAAWVFLGRATERVEAKNSFAQSSSKAWAWAYPVTVTRTWKDRRPKPARGRAAVVVPDWCGVHVQVGTWYVFFADEHGTVTRCLPPVPRSQAKKLMRELDAASPNQD